MKRDFDAWFETFTPSLNSYKYYADFHEITGNVEQIKIELNILSSLIGSRTIESDFEKIIQKYPETLRCIPILLAVRNNEIIANDENGTFIYQFDRMNYSVEQYKYFCRETGLFDLLSNHIVNNLVDYVLGVETGLDSNRRKNRGGKKMENLVESYLIKSGYKYQDDYLKESFLIDAIANWNIDVPNLEKMDQSRKRFDFVLRTTNQVYGIETNFYTSSGSKLNETAKSYALLGLQAKDIKGFTFVWITDGKGWKSAKKDLRNAFQSLKTVFNINDLENGIFDQFRNYHGNG